MTKINRIVTGTLIPIVGIPFLLSVLVNDLPSPMRRLWPYFLVALVLLVASAVYVELRERSAGKTDVDLGEVADRLAKSVYDQWNDEANARRIDTPARLPVTWRISEERPFGTWREVIHCARGWRPGSRLAGCDAASGNPGGEARASTLDELFGQIPPDASSSSADPVPGRPCCW